MGVLFMSINFFSSRPPRHLRFSLKECITRWCYEIAYRIFEKCGLSRACAVCHLIMQISAISHGSICIDTPEVCMWYLIYTANLICISWFSSIGSGCHGKTFKGTCDTEGVERFALLFSWHRTRFGGHDDVLNSTSG